MTLLAVLPAKLTMPSGLNKSKLLRFGTATTEPSANPTTANAAKTPQEETAAQPEGHRVRVALLMASHLQLLQGFLKDKLVSLMSGGSQPDPPRDSAGTIGLQYPNRPGIVEVHQSDVDEAVGLHEAEKQFDGLLDRFPLFRQVLKIKEMPKQVAVLIRQMKADERVQEMLEQHPAGAAASADKRHASVFQHLTPIQQAVPELVRLVKAISGPLERDAHEADAGAEDELPFIPGQYVVPTSMLNRIG